MLVNNFCYGLGCADSICTFTFGYFKIPCPVIKKRLVSEEGQS